MLRQPHVPISLVESENESRPIVQGALTRFFYEFLELFFPSQTRPEPPQFRGYHRFGRLSSLSYVRLYDVKFLLGIGVFGAAARQPVVVPHSWPRVTSPGLSRMATNSVDPLEVLSKASGCALPVQGYLRFEPRLRDAQGPLVLPRLGLTRGP